MIHRWMLEKGLSATELLAFAMIHSYTIYKGCFDGDRIWFSVWCRADASEIDRIIDGLLAKGYVSRSRGRFGRDVYKSRFTAEGRLTGGASALGTSRETNGLNNNINIINNIDSIHNIEKENKKDSMNNMDSIDNIDNMDNINDTVFKNSSFESMDSMDNKGAGDREKIRETAKPPAEDMKLKGSITKELFELIAPYESLPEVPPEVLKEKLDILRQRVAERGSGAGTSPVA